MQLAAAAAECVMPTPNFFLLLILITGFVELKDDGEEENKNWRLYGARMPGCRRRENLIECWQIVSAAVAVLAQSGRVLLLLRSNGLSYFQNDAAAAATFSSSSSRSKATVSIPSPYFDAGIQVVQDTS